MFGQFHLGGIARLLMAAKTKNKFIEELLQWLRKLMNNKERRVPPSTEVKSKEPTVLVLEIRPEMEEHVEMMVSHLCAIGYQKYFKSVKAFTSRHIPLQNLHQLPHNDKEKDKEDQVVNEENEDLISMDDEVILSD